MSSPQDNASWRSQTESPWESELAGYCSSILSHTPWSRSNRMDSEDGEAEPVTVLLTSPLNGQGVTTIGVSMAVVAARSEFCRVLVVDCSCDGESQRFLTWGGFDSPVDLELGRYVQRTSESHVDVLPIYDLPEGDNTASMSDAIRQLVRRYDLVLIDMPYDYSRRWREPILQQTKMALIVASQKCPRRQVACLARRLKHNGVVDVGVIQNMG